MNKIIKYFLNKKNYFSPRDYELKYGFLFKDILFLILQAYIINKNAFNFIQIGANDGKLGDPIFNFCKKNKKIITGVLFEPQIKPFKKLKMNYKNFKNFYFINKAVGTESLMPFFSLNKIFQKEFSKLLKKNNFDGLSSFLKDNLTNRFEKYENFDPSKHISIETLLSCNVLKEIKINLKNKAYNFIKKIDLLQIDAEGYDDIIIFNCNLDILKPALINFEHKNLSSSKRLKLNKYLQSKNYNSFIYSRSDTLAIKQY
jgi:FkbM family methyltransferase